MQKLWFVSSLVHRMKRIENDNLSLGVSHLQYFKMPIDVNQSIEPCLCVRVPLRRNTLQQWNCMFFFTTVDWWSEYETLFLHRLNWLNWKYFCFVRPTVTFRYALLLVSLFVTDIFYRKHALLTWNVSCLTCYNVKTLLSSIWWSILFHSAFVHLSNCFVTVQLYILLHIANQIDDPFLPCINLSNRICIVWTVFCRSFIQRKRCFN